MVDIPEIIAADPFKRQLWEALTKDCQVQPEAVGVLSTLIYWRAIQEQCMRDISGDDGQTHVAYVNDQGDVRAMPQLATLKQASTEIRALEKRLYDPENPLIVREKQEKHVETPLEKARKAHESRVERGKNRRKPRTNVQPPA